MKVKTLDLLVKMTNKDNVEAIVEKLMENIEAVNFESQSNPLSKLVVNIQDLAQKYSPSMKWYVRTINKLFEKGGSHIT